MNRLQQTMRIAGGIAVAIALAACVTPCVADQAGGSGSKQPPISVDPGGGGQRRSSRRSSQEPVGARKIRSRCDVRTVAELATAFVPS